MKTLFLFGLGAFLLSTQPAWAADETSGSAGQNQNRHRGPVHVDPALQRLADETGGRVYDMTHPADVRAFENSFQTSRPAQTHRDWIFSFRWSHETRLLLYVVLKFLAYCGWCWMGLTWIGKTQKIRSALGWGSIRVLLGLAFGVSIFLLMTWLGHPLPSKGLAFVFVYLLIYVPVRWLEWSIMSRLMGLQERKSTWQLGGIIVSCAVDGVQMLLLGSLIPVGRFLC